MYNTQISGPVPSSYSNLQSLQTFKAENCLLDGDISALYAIPTLKTLSVSGNAGISGSLEGAASLTNLEELYVSETSMTGTLEDLGAMFKLRMFGAAEAGFTGPLPESLPVSLVEIDLTNVPLNDTAIPTNLGSLTNIQKLRFTNNGLTGELPDIGAWTSAIVVDMANNRISGVLPEAIGTWTSCKRLTIPNCGKSLKHDAPRGSFLSGGA